MVPIGVPFLGRYWSFVVFTDDHHNSTIKIRLHLSDLLFCHLTKGDVIVTRPTPSGLHNTSRFVNNSSCSIADSKSQQRSNHYGMPPSTSKDSIKTNSSNNHRHHNHSMKRHYSKGKVRKDNGSEGRFSRTATVLRQAGLMKLTLQIAQLIKTNEDLQREIDELQKEAVQFSENLKTQLQQKLQENGSVNELEHKEK